MVESRVDALRHNMVLLNLFGPIAYCLLGNALTYSENENVKMKTNFRKEKFFHFAQINIIFVESKRLHMIVCSWVHVVQPRVFKVQN